MALKVPNSPATSTTVYKDLKGVDFSQDASLVDSRHSPDMLNMISDEGGNPVKRKGWEILYTETRENRTINNVFTFTEDGHEYCVVELRILDTYYNPPRIKYELCQFDFETQTLVNITDHPDIAYAQSAVGVGFYNDNLKDHGFYITLSTNVVAGYKLAKLIPYETDDHEMRLKYEWVEAYIPKTVIARPPSGEGGVAYEPINLLINERTEQFMVTGSSASDFYLQGECYHAGGRLDVEVLNANGDWEDYEGTVVGAVDNLHHVKVNPAIGVTPSEGADNVRITYTVDNRQPDSIAKCHQQAFFTQGSAESVFVTGNPDEPQKVWYSALGDITYFPDTNYLYLGGDGGECMGFLPVQNNLAVLKKGQENGHATTYLIYPTTISSTSVEAINPVTNEPQTKTEAEYVYATKTIASSTGAISKNGFGVLGDEPLFLSSQGLYGITSLNTTADKAVTNRSRSIDRKLAAEDLSDAQVITHNNYLYVFVNNHVYVFDGRQKSADRKNNTSYFYEAYYWESVPAKKVCVVNDNLYFINDNQLCRFKNRGNMTDYSDGSTIVDGEVTGGAPIHARWSTKNDDDNAPQMFKTMMKKGSMCTLAQYERSSVDVWARVDGKIYVDDNGNEIQGDYIGKFYADTWTGFDNIDFDRFTFDTHDGPRDYFFRKKKKKYIRLQLIFENNEKDEAFGIHQVVKSYTATRYAK